MLAYMKQLLTDADLILALNVRFDEMTTASYSLFDVPVMAATLIHSHASDAELGKIYTADLPLHAGPNQMAALLARLRLPVSATRTNWATAARGLSWQLYCPQPPGDIDMRHNGASAGGASRRRHHHSWHRQFCHVAQQILQIRPRRAPAWPQSGGMGFGVTAALAAKAYDPDRFVFSALPVTVISR